MGIDTSTLKRQYGNHFYIMSAASRRNWDKRQPVGYDGVNFRARTSCDATGRVIRSAKSPKSSPAYKSRTWNVPSIPRVAHCAVMLNLRQEG